MIEKPDCERCQRIKSAIDQGVPPYEAREAHGWDECSEDDCPMVPLPFGLGPVGGGGFGRGA